MVQPMTTTSFARRNVSGSSAAARARLVKGPIATMVMVSLSFSRSKRSISSWEGFCDGRNMASGSRSSSSLTPAPSRFDAGSKRAFQVSAGDKCGCFRDDQSLLMSGMANAYRFVDIPNAVNAV